MLSVTDLRPLDTATADLSRIIPRANVDVSSVVPVVAPIIEQVRHGDEQTLLELAERFDVDEIMIQPIAGAMKGEDVREDPGRIQTIELLAAEFLGGVNV